MAPSVRALALSSPFALLLAAVAFAGCAGGDDSSAGSSTPTPPVTTGSPDSGAFVFVGADAGVDSGPLLHSACDPANPSSCPTGFHVFRAAHVHELVLVDSSTAPAFACTPAGPHPLRVSLGWRLRVPRAPRGESPTGACAADGGGASEVCVPAVKPGTTPRGEREGDGGCGTPGVRRRGSRRRGEPRS